MCKLTWPADPNKLYTVMHFDHSGPSLAFHLIFSFQDSTSMIQVVDGAPQILTSEAQRSPPQERPQQFLMWVVTTITGNNVHIGNEMFEFLAPLAIELNRSDFNKDYAAHNSPYLVYEPQERVDSLFENEAHKTDSCRL